MTKLSINVPSGVMEKLSKASKEFGIEKKEVVNRVLLVYLDMIKEELSLRKEFGMWDRLSDEALLSFEGSL